ncbi:MAG: hypothetical protein C0596_14830 [Marinilabiliales bacterium]|nr:MAG: hypothetical protein C0596_14830 [Marinilabiliales bacterium]
MKRLYKFTLLSLTIVLFSLNIFAQNQTVKTPDSFVHNLSIENIDHLELVPPSHDLIKSEDLIDEKNGQMMKIARLLPVDANVDNSGTWTELDNGKMIWRLHMSSNGARSSVVHFDRFKLPAGSELWVYNPDHSVILGPYTSEDNIKGEEFSIGMIYGEDLIIEYSARMEKSDDGDIIPIKPDMQIAAYSYVYRGEDMFDNRAKGTGYGASDDCQVNINCSEGDNWRDEQKGVARIYCVEGWSAGYCTGTLVNNTSNDETPYFLTADHCGTDSDAGDFNQWIFKFNYESSGCTATSEPSGNSVTGCTRKSRSVLNGGSDFLLVELSTTATTLKNIGAVYNGWSRSTSASPSGVSIHHPSGDIKKISTYTSSLSSATYNGGTGNVGATGAHWVVYWASTTNGHGVTEPGSSGSPIFNNSGLVVGTLSGGLSYCDATGDPDLYGKFSYHWNSNGTASSEQLEYWLDPSSTGATTCEMLDPNIGGVVADFSGTPTLVAVGGQVSFTDLSSGGTITSRSWSFPGGSPSSSTAQNPTITYNTEGTYNVSLTVYTSGDNDTETKTGYITVTSGGGFSYDFEDCTDFAVDNFSPCTTYDGDESTTYGVDGVDFNNEGYTGAYMAFNSSTTSPESSESWDPHGGYKCGACFAATSPANDDWFITPQISLQNNSSLSFWAKSVTDTYGLERFKVLVSTTNNSTGSFSVISSGSYIEAPTSWTQYTADLSAYDGQSIYIAFQCVSYDAWAFLIDDLLVETSSSIENEIAESIHIYPNPSDGIITIALPESNAKISVKNMIGQEVTSLFTESEQTTIDLSTQDAGIYFIEIEMSSGKFTKKITLK